MKFPLETVVVSERSLNITDADYYDIAHDIEPEHAAFIVLACNSFDALTEANKKLREALEKILPLYQSFVCDAGGCDHSVGICMCADFEALRLAGAALKVTP